MTWCLLLFTVAASPDAGTPTHAAATAPKSADAGAASVPNPTPAAPAYDAHLAELSALRREVQAMRESTERLNQRLETTSRELAAVRAQSEAATRELEAIRTQQQQAVARDQASKTAAVQLGNVDQQLSTGDTAVEQRLTAVESSLGPSARSNLQAARDAIANGDLTNARAYLARAAADAQAGR